MRTATVNRAAFGSALLLHAVVLLMGQATPAPEEPEQPIAIRFTSIEERAVAPLPTAQAQPLAEKLPPPVSELTPPRLPEPVRRQEPVPVPAPATHPAPQVAAEQVPAAVAPPRPSPVVAAAAVSRSVPQETPSAPPVPQPRKESAQRQEVATPAAPSRPSGRLGDYLASVRGMVENNREYPASARQLGQQGTVTVRVLIRADGSIGDVVVAASAGHKSLDRAAVSAVKRAAPFRSPGGFGLGEVTVEIPIVYRLT